MTSTSEPLDFTLHCSLIAHLFASTIPVPPLHIQRNHHTLVMSNDLTFMSPTKPLNYLITGAGRGIGRGLSRILLHQGHRVLLVDSNESELMHTCTKLSQTLPTFPHTQSARASNTAQSSNSAQSSNTTPRDPPSQPANNPLPQKQFHSILADLSSQRDIQKIATTAASFFSSHLDVLVNNAAHTTTTSGASAVGGTSILDRAGYAGHTSTSSNSSSTSASTTKTSDAPDAASADCTATAQEEDTFADVWQGSLETNLTAPVMLSRALLPLLQHYDKSSPQSPQTSQSPQPTHDPSDNPSPSDRPTERPTGGNIINITSTRAHQSESNSEAYAATKAGLLGLTQSLAVSLQEVGVRVNAVTLGWINVGNENKEADEEAEGKGSGGAWPGMRWEDSGGMTQQDHEWHPAGRVGRVEDVARAVGYLSEAKFVTGTEIVVSGGVERKMVYPE